MKTVLFVWFWYWIFQNGISKNIFIGLHKHFILDYSGISNWIIKTVFLLDYTSISYWITRVFQTGLSRTFLLEYSGILNWIILKFLIGLPGMRLCLCHQHRPWRWHSMANCLPTFEGKHFDSPSGPQPPKANLKLLSCFTPKLLFWS